MIGKGHFSKLRNELYETGIQRGWEVTEDSILVGQGSKNSFALKIARFGIKKYEDEYVKLINTNQDELIKNGVIDKKYIMTDDFNNQILKFLDIMFKDRIGQLFPEMKGVEIYFYSSKSAKVGERDDKTQKIYVI